MGTQPASFLTSLEEDLDRPIGEYFDLIAGTSTGGILAFPFTPPELAAGTAYRYALYHVMPADNGRELFPVSVEDLQA